LTNDAPYFGGSKEHEHDSLFYETDRLIELNDKTENGTRAPTAQEKDVKNREVLSLPARRQTKRKDSLGDKPHYTMINVPP
jgi:hypothetical protein